MRYCFDAYFKDDAEYKDFAQWAVGDMSYDIRDTPKHWNKLHGDLLIIKEDDWIPDTLPKMIDLWKKETKGSSEG